MTEETMMRPDTTGMTGAGPMGDEETITAAQLMAQDADDDGMPPWDTDDGVPDDGEPGGGMTGGMPDDGVLDDGVPDDGEPGGGEPGGGVPGDGEPGDGVPGDGEPDDGEPGDGVPGDGVPGDGVPDEAQCRAALQELLDNGFTMEELRAFSQDAASRFAVASGMTIARAATEFLRRRMARPAAAPAKRGVPTMRTAAAGERREGNAVEQMSDAQFRAFSKRAMEATLAGRRVRLD